MRPVVGKLYTLDGPAQLMKASVSGRKISRKSRSYLELFTIPLGTDRGAALVLVPRALPRPYLYRR